MVLGRFCVLGALHEHHWVFGLVIGRLPEIPAVGVVVNLGAGGIIIGMLTDD